MSRVLVGMSGGVDSAVTALLLKRAGHDVTGVTLKLWEKSEGADASAVAKCLGINHITVQMEDLFKEEVQKDFAYSYLKGETPNPCVICNRRAKFHGLLKTAEEMGFDFVATGHYARVMKKDGEYVICKAKDLKKDQSYVLCRLDKEDIPKIIFPLGEYTKEEIRNIASEIDLPTAKKPDSQEICFIPDNDYAAFVEKFTGTVPPEGNIIDSKGNILGRHSGIHRYTIGQRKGLGAYSCPMFVTGINAADNTVIIGKSGEEYSDRMFVRDLNFMAAGAENMTQADVKVRYAAPPVPAKIIVDGNRAQVIFEKPCRAVTPGQAAVFYRDDLLLGGGFIE